MLSDITLGQYFPGNSYLHRMDPRVKILLTFACIVFVFVANNFFALLSIVALVVIAMLLSGISPDKRIVEMVEIPDHPWFVGCQFHPEFKSRPNRPHPLFSGFVGAAVKYSESK